MTSNTTTYTTVTIGNWADIKQALKANRAVQAGQLLESSDYSQVFIIGGTECVRLGEKNRLTTDTKTVYQYKAKNGNITRYADAQTVQEVDAQTAKAMREKRKTLDAARAMGLISDTEYAAHVELLA